jgi:hypothetical protein
VPDIIDAHVHVGEWRDPAYGGRCIDFDSTVAALVRAGVRAAFLFPTDGKENVSLLSCIKGLRRDDFTAYFFPWVDIERDDFLGFLRAEREWVRGLKFHPSFDRKPVTDPAYTPAFDFARQHRLPVIVHCGRWTEVAGYEFPLARARGLPEVTFVLSHMGGDRPELQRGAVRSVLEKRLGNVLFGTESVREYWSLEQGIAEMGADRFLFGSDFSLGHPAIYLAVLGLCEISGQDRAKILAGNAGNLVRASGGM